MYKRLQYISQGVTAEEQHHNIRSVLDAGCDWVQLRFKNATNLEVLELATQIKELTTSYKATFIVNDNVTLAKEIDADGVHLGLSDMPADKAREILGDKKIIGGTANTFEDILLRVKEGCNYVGLGPFRFTNTKQNLSPILGLEGYQKTMNSLKQNNIHIPVYAIGGITVDDVANIINTGIYGIAVSGLLTKENNKELMLELKKILK